MDGTVDTGIGHRNGDSGHETCRHGEHRRRHAETYCTSAHSVASQHIGRTQRRGSGVCRTNGTRGFPGTNWLKLEIHPDRYLLPDSVETLKATEELVKLGFINVLPYCQADPVLCKQLEEAGAATVMPLEHLSEPIKGLQTKEFLQIIIEQAGIPVVVDAGIGAPSHAAEAMEMGASACLVNTAIAVAGNPIEMAKSLQSRQ